MESVNTKTFKRVVGELKATYNKLNQLPAVKISSANCINDYVRKFYPVDIETREAFVCIYLNRANNIQGFAVISIGGVSGTIADPKVIFQHALLCNASSLIMVHNHPSGNLNPSSADIHLTKKIKEAGKLLDLPLLDHLIITDESYFSFADDGIL